MPLDRSDPNYRPVEIMLGPRGPYSDLRDYADTVSPGPRDQLEARIEDLPLSTTEQVRIRLAFAFWNGSVRVDLTEMGYFDEENRKRVLEAFAAFLGVIPDG